MTARQPIYFGPSERPLFGWLHTPATGPSATGVVLCSPFGYEGVCAHRSLKRFAHAFAEAGMPALRFDYDGVGDSAGEPTDANRLASWVQSVKLAIEVLKARTGVTRIALLGVRLGAALAALAADACGGVDGFIAVAPVVLGKGYLRELRALQRLMGLAAPPPGTEPLPEGTLESAGFVMLPETVAEVTALDLVGRALKPAPRVLVIDHDSLPQADAWLEKLRQLGAHVEAPKVAGYTSMVLDPHNASVPEQIIGTAVDWLKASLSSELAPSAAAEHRETPAAASVEMPWNSGNGQTHVSELATFIDPERRLFAVVTRPPASVEKSQPLGLLILNAGAVHHVGPNRLYVSLARRLAQQGYTVLRLDISGIGDSSPHPGEPENSVYTARAAEDIQCALRYLRELGAQRSAAIGLCSGAYNAFKAGVRGDDIASIIAINPLTFFWKEGMTLDLPPHKVLSESKRYAKSLWRLESWKKALRGDAHLGVAARVMARRAAVVGAREFRELAKKVGRPLPDDLAVELETVAKRGIHLAFVFASNDPGFELLRAQGRRSVGRLQRAAQLSLDIIEGPDHTFTPVWSHPILTERLTRLVESIS